jgi:hypothetical protein
VALLAAGCTAALRGAPDPRILDAVDGRWVAPDSTAASVRAQIERQHPTLARTPGDSARDSERDTDEVLIGLPGFVRPDYEPGDWDDPEESLAATEVARSVPARLVLGVSDSLVTIEGLHHAPMSLPYRGRDIVVTAAGAEVRVKAWWDGEVLVIQRSFGRARILDRLRRGEYGARLILERTVVHGALDFRFRVAYERAAAAR